MSANMNDFLLEYYKRLIFRSMPIEQFVHYCEFIKSGDMAGNMKEWADTLLKKDPTTGNFIENAGLYVPKELPDPEEAGGEWELDDTEWEKLFNAFNNAFQAMDANKKSFKYEKKAKDFLEKYFGTSGQLFSYTTANTEAESKISELKNILLAHESDMKQLLKGYFNDDFSWKNLIDGINSKEYNKNPKFRQILINIAEALEYDTKYNVPSPVKKMVGRQLNFGAISKGFENSSINRAKMIQFKLVYPDLLKELYTNTKAFEFFSASDPTKISKQLNEAKQRLDYNDPNSKGYISPKRKDELTLPQQISEWWSDTYSNYLEKYVKLTGDRMYFSPYSKAIIKEIDELKIKPTDGLSKILDNSNTILEELKKKFKKAPDHFEWFSKTLTELSKSMGKGKAFQKALQNGRLLNILVQEIIIKAVRENKIDEAKTTLELLAALRYSLTTSKIMDALNKSNLTIFSDKGLSWNGNEGVKFVTTVLDQTIEKALEIFGYTITIAGNIVNRIGTKFNGKEGNRIKAAREEKQAENNMKRDQVSDSIDRYGTEKRQIEDDLSVMRARGITEANLDSKITSYTATIDHEKDNFNNNIEDLKTWLLSNTTHPDAPKVQYILNEVESNDIEADIPDRTTMPMTLPTLQAKVDSIINSQKIYKLTDKQLKRKQNKRQQFYEATDAINTFDDLITKAEEEISTWDEKHALKYDELINFWDICNSGTVKSYFGNAKLKQKAFDKNKKQIFQDYMDNHPIR